MNPQSKEPTPITWQSLPGWIQKTLKADRYYYKPNYQTLSLKRFQSLLKPNLDNPIFLIGSPRSGTTFLGDCLSVLPEVSYHHEPVATKAAARYIYESNWSFEQSQRFYRSFYGLLLQVYFDGHLRFAEKTPRNALIIPFLKEAFPQAQFIHIIRDGRDAALSHSKKPWLQAATANSGRREPGGYLYGPYARFWVEPDRREEFETTSDIHRCIWNWRVFNEQALQAAEALASQQYIQIRYEALVSNPDEVGQTILDFLKISNDHSRRLFSKAMSQAKSDSVGNWRKEVSTNELNQIYAEAGYLLQQLEYLESSSFNASETSLPRV